MLECCPMSTLIDGSVKLLPQKGSSFCQLSYSKMIGSLMYAMTLTRPDIAYVVRKLSRNTSNAGPSLWIAIQIVRWYLKGTMSHGLCYSGEPLSLEGYSDAC